MKQCYKVGFVANSDGHKGRPGASHPGPSRFGAYGGLTCVLAESLTRDAVFDAITLTPRTLTPRPCAAGAICTGFA